MSSTRGIAPSGRRGESLEEMASRLGVSLTPAKAAPPPPKRERQRVSPAPPRKYVPTGRPTGREKTCPHPDTAHRPRSRTNKAGDAVYWYCIECNKLSAKKSEKRLAAKRKGANVVDVRGRGGDTE